MTGEELKTWEAERRKDLENKVQDKMYDLSINGMVLLTGKNGYIDYLIEFEKSLMDFTRK